MKKRLLSYYELTKMLNESKCILNDRILDYLESLLKLNSSILSKNCIDDAVVSYLNELQLFRDLALYNIYYKSLKLVDNNDIFFIDDKCNILNIGVTAECFNVNCFSLDYSDDVYNIYLHMNNFDKTYGCFVLREKNLFLYKFLLQNDLCLSDFYQEFGSNGDYKIKKYGFANIIIK